MSLCILSAISACTGAICIAPWGCATGPPTLPSVWQPTRQHAYTHTHPMNTFDRLKLVLFVRPPKTSKQGQSFCVLQRGYTSSHIFTLHLHQGNLKLWPYYQHFCKKLCCFCTKIDAVFRQISKWNWLFCQKGPRSNPSPARLHVFKPVLFSYPETLDYSLLILVNTALFHRCLCCICQKRTTRNLIRGINTPKVTVFHL